MFKLANVTVNASATGSPVITVQTPTSSGGVTNEKIGRNDPCPCGSGKKWKKCGLLNTAEHQKNMAQGGRKHEVTGG